MSASTFGVAIMLADAYHNGDKDGFDVIIESVDMGTIVASTFQLAHHLLRVLPGARLAIGKRDFDLRPEAFDHFAEYLSSNTARSSYFSDVDPAFIVTATTTIVMGSIVPLIENQESPTVSVEYEGVDARAFLVIMASIAEASIEAFREYVGLIDSLPDLGEHPTYQQASDSLLKSTTTLAYFLEKAGSDNV